MMSYPELKQAEYKSRLRSENKLSKASNSLIDKKVYLDHVKINILAARAGVFLGRMCNGMNLPMEGHTK